MVWPKDMKTFTVKHDKDLLGGVTALCGGGLADGETPVQFIAIPYYAW